MLTIDIIRRWLLAAAIGAALAFAAHGARAQAPGPYFAADQARKGAPSLLKNARNNKARLFEQNVNGGISTMVARAAEAHGVPVRVALAVMAIESGGRCGARNRSAVGLFQVLPRTAASLGIRGNLLDCQRGAEAGLRYLSLIIRAHGVSCASLSLYERGIAARPVCTAYARKILARM